MADAEIASAVERVRESARFETDAALQSARTKADAATLLALADAKRNAEVCGCVTLISLAPWAHACAAGVAQAAMAAAKADWGARQTSMVGMADRSRQAALDALEARHRDAVAAVMRQALGDREATVRKILEEKVRRRGGVGRGEGGFATTQRCTGGSRGGGRGKQPGRH